MVKILLIEDDELVRENVLELLDAEGFETYAAENGRVGTIVAQQKAPDLILCDAKKAQVQVLKNWCFWKNLQRFFL